jgi:hypothetical protein
MRRREFIAGLAIDALYTRRLIESLQSSNESVLGVGGLRWRPIWGPS